MGDEVGAHLHARLGALCVHPLRIAGLGPRALLHHHHVRGDFGVRGERRARQAHRAQELGPFRKPPAGGAALLVQSALRGDERHHAARPHQVERAGEEVVVDEQPLAPVARVVHLVAPEGDVADRHVERVVRKVGALEPAVADVGAGVERSGDARGEGVELHADEPASRERFRHAPEERPRAARRLEHAAPREAHGLYRLPYRADDSGRRVEGGEGGRPRGGPLLAGQQRPQPFAFGRPFGRRFVEHVGEAAPSDVARERRELPRAGVSAPFLDAQKGLDGEDVCAQALERRLAPSVGGAVGLREEDGELSLLGGFLPWNGGSGRTARFPRCPFAAARRRRFLS